MYNGGNFCGCCGTTWTSGASAPKMPNHGNGIRVIEGTHYEEGSKTKSTQRVTSVNHVKTRNGDLTIVTNHKRKE